MSLILLVDDDVDFCRMLRTTLEHKGHQVIEAHDGKAAMQQAGRAPVDLVLIDLIMPDQEGLETIQQLRRLLPNLKIIAMSAGVQGRPKDVLKAAQLLGAMQCLAKPFSADELESALDAAFAANPGDGPH